MTSHDENTVYLDHAGMRRELKPQKQIFVVSGIRTKDPMMVQYFTGMLDLRIAGTERSVQAR